MHEMGKKFNDVVKQVGKKLTLSEKYIPLTMDLIALLVTQIVSAL